MIIGLSFITALIIVTSINFKYKMKKQLTDQDKEIIIELIANCALCDPDHLEEETRFEQDLTLDSLDIVELIMKIEQEFNIRIADNDIESCKAVKQLFNLVAERL